MSGPTVLFCYYCGQENPVPGFKFHFPECQNKWKAQEEKKPKNQQKPLPKPPSNLHQVLNHQQPPTKKQINKFNQEARQIHNKDVKTQCQNCGRSFYTQQLQKHQKHCTKQNPMLKRAQFSKSIQKKQYQNQIQPLLRKGNSKLKSYKSYNDNASYKSYNESGGDSKVLKKKSSFGVNKVLKSSFVNQNQNQFYSDQEQEVLPKRKSSKLKVQTINLQSRRTNQFKTLKIDRMEQPKKMSMVPNNIQRGSTKPKTAIKKGRRKSKSLQGHQYDPLSYLPGGKDSISQFNQSGLLLMR